MVADLLAETSKRGDVPGDVAAEELGSFCLHTLAAASGLASKAAARRLVSVTSPGISPPA